MHNKSVAELSRDLESGQVSSVELTHQFLERIKQEDSKYNSFITVTEEQALADARAADERRAAGNATPWTGIPFAHKDIFCTNGVRTTCGSKMLENFVPPYDATVTANFRDAGAVCLGKTNMDEFAMGSSNESSFFGAVTNPWGLSPGEKRVPGGSSGGSAAAVAARLVPAATATDTGGSIRQPAALCGITGLKPTYGRVSRYGMIAFASSLDQGGTMARTAEDNALMLNVMAGFDPKDSTSIDREVPDYTATLNEPLKGLKIGLPKEYFSDQLSPAMEQQVRNAVKEYEKLGATVKEVSLPNARLAIAAYYVIAPAEASANLSRFDGVRYGYRCEDPKDLMDLYTRTRAEGFGAEVKRRILVGTYALSAGYFDAYYLKAQKVRRLIQQDFINAFKEVDVLMSPTTPSPAFIQGEKT
ncbi:MAG: Asp-tRNA(Asn)/Glu-tRNA(Gln) amidotransferase subunit GatA, partial [Pseudomonadota bacterium]|nr:Asp-tRNA(Asn)/Glu-tRNA(Gln) amidotransferase subunit GatA [Pseudomonadota bacterium]